MEASKDKVKNLPNQPGVYFMKDKLGNIIYIGKSKNLNKRVRQYFQASKVRSPKIDKMIVNIADVGYQTTDTELEALILECRLIKEHKPLYNTRMKKHRTYPYLKITLNEMYPRIVVDYDVKEDGALYFGPYTRKHCVDEVVLWLEEHYPIRRCRQPINDRITSPCLYARLGKCMAPCEEKEVKQKYDQMIQKIIDFLDGRNKQPLIEMEKKMKRAAESMAFEEAIRYKIQLNALRHVSRKHAIVKMALKDQAIVAFEPLNASEVKIYFIRHGQLKGDYKIQLYDLKEQKGKASVVDFIEHFYNNGIKSNKAEGLGVAQGWVDEAQIIESWLSKHHKTYLILEDQQGKVTRGKEIKSWINRFIRDV